jgi:hypothetical protein
MVNSPIFGINNSSAAASSTSIPTAPLAPVSPTVVAGATAYNATLDWLEYTGTGTPASGLMNTNYSPQTQVTNANVNQLQVSYIFPLPSALSSATAFTTRVTGYTYTGGNEGTQSAVLTVNGTAYVLSNYLNIYGFNLATGAQLSTPAACPAPATGSSLGALLKAGTCALGTPGEMDPAFDFGAWLKQPEAGGGPSHQHGWNIVSVPGAGAVAWVPGWGCSIQGWQVSTGKLVANLTGMCDNTPGSIHPTAGSGKTFSNGIGEVQVSTKYNEIIFWAAGNSEGTGGYPMNVYACSLSGAIAGGNCTPTGGACTTVAGGLCSSGSGMLWRTFMMPAYDGSTPNFALNLCAKGHIWIVGVPCSAIEAVNNVIQYDSGRPDLASSWGGDIMAPSTGCSGAWGQIAVDETDGVMAIGTGDTGPDWNHTLSMGFSILCNAVVGLNLQNGSVIWSDKSFTKDINDEDCNLNTIFVRLTAATGGNLMPNGGPTFVKTCKSSATFAMNGITGQPLWFLDPTMPDYTTISSATTSPYSRAMICSTTNATACDVGRVWDQIFHKIKTNNSAWNAPWISGSIKMQGTNPHPHGFITGSPLRGQSILDPLNNTEIGTCTGLGTSAVKCDPGATCPTGMHAACVAMDVQGKGPGYYENRYLAESEDGVDPATGVFFSVVMSGPQEHDWIGDVDKQGQSGNISGTNLYFGGQQTTNSTMFAIQIGTGQVLWNYTRQIYYRGGIVVTGGLVISDWPDGHLIFNDEKSGAVLRDINVGVPLLAPMSIGPDRNGVEHLLVTYGGVNHGILGEAGLHGPLGRGYVTTGAVISYVLGPAPATTVSTTTATSTISNTVTSTVTGPGGSTSVVTSVHTSLVTTTSTVAGSLSTVTTSVGTTGVSDLAFYGAVGVAAILAIVAGALVVLRRRPGA